MDYCQLLYKAQENNRNAATKKLDRCYTTTYEAPKKIERSKVSSENIKKFLARKEEEEKKKLLEAKKKKDELLALRSQDKKAQKRVQVMLKRTKSANKSVMEDAIDNVNTAHTLAGPVQCDEDDYGYVSQEASAFYNKLIDKYQNMPVEKSLFSKGKREVKDLNAAKDRVKAALQKEADDELLPHKRKRKKKDDQETTEQESMPCDGKESKKIDSFDDRSKREEPLKKKPVRSMPPPVDFKQLLKIAEKKQFEPIVIEKIAEDKEERPMTKKEKLEYMKEQERKFKRVTGKPPHQEKDNQISEKSLVSEKNRSEKHKSTQHEKIQKNKVNQNDVTTEIKNSTENKKPILSNEKGSNKSDRVMPSSQIDEKLKKSAEVWAKPCNISNKLLNKNNHMKKPILPNIEKNKKSGAIQKTVSNNTKCQNITEKKPVNITELSEIDREIELLRRKRELLANRSITNEKKEIKPTVNNNNKPRPKVIKDAKPRQLVNPKKAKLNKRRLDSDSEYDSELDDFIDDGPEDYEEDYSKHIQEIFGYDKSRYSRFNDDDECMESNFAQQMKEEYVSTKIGIMEDLEDMRKEQEEKANRKKMKKSSRS